MRHLALIVLVIFVVASCQEKPLTDPDAQRVIAEAKAVHFDSATGPVFLLDGVRLTSEQERLGIDPATVATVEILKGTVAKSRYGSEGARGVVLITTKRAAAARGASR